MPGRDGTGPIGNGPMTGRGAGLCFGVVSPRYTMTGGCRGRRICYDSYIPAGNFYYAGANEKQYLNTQIEFLENQLQQLRNQLSSLNKDVE